jgi:hypothetical protein
MWAITIENGNDQSQLFYYSEEKARNRIKELLIVELNKKIIDWGENPIFLDVDLDYIPSLDLQTILTSMIKFENGDVAYDDYKYEVTISKIEFEDN